MVRTWNEKSFADSVLLKRWIAALASALIPTCAGLLVSTARATGTKPTRLPMNNPAAIPTYPNFMIISEEDQYRCSFHCRPVPKRKLRDLMRKSETEVARGNRPYSFKQE